MKRFGRAAALSLAVFVLTAYLAPGPHAEQKKGQKDVVLSTQDVPGDYEVVGIISIRSGEVDLAKINDKLKEEAKNLQADSVIGVGYFDYSGYIYAYGTAVKQKKTESTSSQKHAF